MKTKITLFLTAIVLSVVTLASCQLSDILGGMGANATKTKYTRIVYDEETVELTELVDIRSALFTMYSEATLLAAGESDPADGEVVFGDTDRDITEAAKKKLDKELKKSGGQVGIIIYAEGKNVAVYWTDEGMKKTAISAFYTECISGANMKFEDAEVVYVQGYTTKQYSQEKYWLAIKEQGCDDETLEALRSLNAFFNGSTYVEWMANLWDEDVGGFYYSASARDNEPYRPDLESTNQLTNWLVSHGATGGIGRNEFLPHDMKVKIVNFVKNMQSPTEGYFLNPQWPQSYKLLGTDRYGRDLSWAVSILKSLTIDTDGDGIEEKQYPNFCTPSGYKCEKHEKEGGTCDFSVTTTASYDSGFAKTAASSSEAVTVSLRDGKSGAGAKLMKQAQARTATQVVSKNPDYSSSAAFTQWLWDINGGLEGMLPHSGNAHNINALQDEIIGKGFGDELVAFLDEMQQQIIDYQKANNEEPTYVWQSEINYGAVWGVLKYMPFYNSAVCGKEIPLDIALGMVRTSIKVIKLGIDDERPALNDLMNQWSSISQVLANVKEHHGSYGTEQVYAIVRAEAVDLIYACIDKLSHYKLDNGLFAYTYNRTSLSNIYGVPISLGLEECDVNGSVMAASQYAGMFGTLGYSTVPLCTEVDGENFLRIIDGLEPIEKIPVPKGETITFDNEEYISNVSSNVQTDGFDLAIAADPSDGTNNTLMFKSGTAPQFGDAISFATTGTGGSCFIVEFDVYFRDVSGVTRSGKDIFQVRVGDLYMFTMGHSGNNVYMGYRESTGAGPADADFAVGKKNKDGWCRMRLELYYPDTNDDGELKVKFFLNDEYIGTDNHHFGGGGINTTFTKITFTSRKDFTTEIYFDNCYFNRETKSYDATNHEITDSRD